MVYVSFMGGSERTGVDPGAVLSTPSGGSRSLAPGTPGMARGLAREEIDTPT